MREEVIAAIPQEGQDTVLEVALTHDEVGRSGVELRFLSWGGPKLGWYRQQTLTVNGTTIRQLLHSLGVAQCRLGQMTATAQMSNVLPFPRDRRVHAATEQPSTSGVQDHGGTALTSAQR